MRLLLKRPPKPVPASIDPVQAREGLRKWGVGRGEIAKVFASIKDRAAREALEDRWEYSVEIRRDDPFISVLAQALGKTSADIDQLFRDAAG